MLSAAETDVCWLANPNLYNVSNNSWPEASPVNTLPLALAPCLPGARPTISSRAMLSPNAATGRQ